ncbi:MAG: hypothetical protein JSW16_04805 [Dehalococcoidales bacterium]|nr:MAG: hypothetical protein JSW16_04805 [Dehalococcoidales bacterium]
MIGLIAALFLVAMLIGAAVTEGVEPIGTAGITLGLLGILALASCILSWWREWLAAILLVLTAAGFGAHIGVFAGRNHFLAWLMVGFPYLITGVLFFVSRRLSTKTP